MAVSCNPDQSSDHYIVHAALTAAIGVHRAWDRAELVLAFAVPRAN